jgi:hypothetical protein
MITNSLFTYACAGLIGVLFGTALAFAGYRLFVVLLPIWGFFFGLALGAQSMQVLFGTEPLATVTSWVVGFIVGAIFAALSYMFYLFAVAIIAGSLGYVATVGILLTFMQWGFLVWLLGIVIGLVAVFVTLYFNLQKYVVVIATSVLGAATIFGTILYMFNPLTTLMANPVKVLLSTSPWLLVLFLIVAGLGIFVQLYTSRRVTVEEYNRLETV